MIQQTTTTSFKQELLQGVHNFGPTSPDVFRIALYTAIADLGPTTTAYTTVNEVTGAGYTAGGVTLSISTPPTTGIGSNQIPTAFISFSPAIWTAASFTARGALIYNSSKSNRAVAVLDFGSDKTAAPNLTVSFPTADALSAIVRIT